MSSLSGPGSVGGDGDDYDDSGSPGVGGTGGEDEGMGFPSWFNERPIPLDSSTTNVIIIDHLPQAPLDRYEKLVQFVSKKFSIYGNIIRDGLYIPIIGN